MQHTTFISLSVLLKFVIHFVYFWRPRRAQQRKKKGSNAKVDYDAHLSAKQRRKIKSKAIISSSEDSSDSDVEKLKIANDDDGR